MPRKKPIRSASKGKRGFSRSPKVNTQTPASTSSRTAGPPVASRQPKPAAPTNDEAKAARQILDRLHSTSLTVERCLRDASAIKEIEELREGLQRTISSFSGALNSSQGTSSETEKDKDPETFWNHLADWASFAEAQGCRFFADERAVLSLDGENWKQLKRMGEHWLLEEIRKLLSRRFTKTHGLRGLQAQLEETASRMLKTTGDGREHEPLAKGQAPAVELLEALTATVIGVSDLMGDEKRLGQLTKGLIAELGECARIGSELPLKIVVSRAAEVDFHWRSRPRDPA